MHRKLFTATAVMSAMCLIPDQALSQGGGTVGLSARERSSVKAELERGYSLKEQRRHAGAIAAFNGVLKKDAGNHAALTELGYLHATLKQYNSAAKYLSAASIQDPDNMRIHMDLGYAYQALKKPGAATEQFRLVAAASGEFQAQAEEALKVVSASPEVMVDMNAKQLRLREKGYAALKRGDGAAARKAFAAAVANDPKDQASLKQLGFIELGDKNLPAAAAHFEAIRAIDPGDYFIALQLGYTYDRLQKKEQAREAFGAALSSTDAMIHDAAQSAIKSTEGPALGGGRSSAL